MDRTITIRHVERGSCCLIKRIGETSAGDENPGFTIVPVRLFINEKGLAKLVVALAKGKKEYDKRESIKEKDDRRDMARMFKR